MKRPYDPFEEKSSEEIYEKEELLEDDNLEKHDKLAMFLAAMKVFLPPVLLILGLFSLLIFFFWVYKQNLRVNNKCKQRKEWFYE